jgi:hypothetical protein
MVRVVLMQVEVVDNLKVNQDQHKVQVDQEVVEVRDKVVLMVMLVQQILAVVEVV